MKYSLLLSLLTLLLVGCNTIHGVGEDIEAGGNAISDAAEEMSETDDDDDDDDDEHEHKHDED